MTLHQWAGRSQRLRRELEALYSQPVWNTRAIDRVSDELTEAQKILGRYAAGGFTVPAAAAFETIEP